MKNFGKSLFLISILLLLSGCVKNEFKIEFEFPKEYFGNYLVSYHAQDSRGGFWVEQTASIQEGVAFVDGVTRKPTIVYITDASAGSKSIAIYVERGDKIKISGKGGDMMQWTVSGNKINERWSEWRNGAKPGTRGSRVSEESIAEFVKANPSDKLSALILLTEWNRRENPDGFLKLWNSIDKDARSQKIVELCGNPDLLGVEFTTDADGNLQRAKDPKMKKLVVRSRDNGVDTFVFNKVKASLLYFYSDNNNARKELADTLKSLVKAYPDSTKRILTDIAVNKDSTSWVSPLRYDSIKGVVRGWQPKGIAEDEMVKLGVIRLPWIIVKDKSGTETYSGDDLKAAVAAFRKEMKKPDKKLDKKEDKKPEKPDKPDKPENKPNKPDLSKKPVKPQKK